MQQSRLTKTCNCLVFKRFLIVLVSVFLSTWGGFGKAYGYGEIELFEAAKSYFSDDSTFIEWSSIFGTGSEIAPGGSLTYLFSSDTKLGNLNYEALFTDLSIIIGTSAPVSVPEPTTLLLLGSGLLMAAGIRRRRGNGNSKIHYSFSSLLFLK